MGFLISFYDLFGSLSVLWPASPSIPLRYHNALNNSKDYRFKERERETERDDKQRRRKRERERDSKQRETEREREKEREWD